MENVIIRNVRKEDIPDVVDIQISSWQTAYRGIVDDKYLDNMNKEERIEKRNKDYQNGGFIVAEINGEIVGFSRYAFNNSFTPDVQDIDCELLALYVKPNLKGNGIGRKMFEHVTNEFKNKNKSKMILWCFKENYPSRKFYERMGGTVFKEKPITFGNKDYLEISYLYDF